MIFDDLFDLIISAESLRKDRDLIEMVFKVMDIILQLLKNGKKIPESILLPTLDFVKNFVDICHHGKEEDSLFPELERRGMPTCTGPIATISWNTNKLEKLPIGWHYPQKNTLSGSAEKLICDITQYIKHMAQHHWKEITGSSLLAR